MISPNAIANYESLFALTGQMREAAERGAWEQLADYERRRSELVDAMKPVDAAAKLDEEARQRKVQLITGIFVDDEVIRKHIQTWMKQMQHSMQSYRQEQRLLKAYGT